MARNVGVGIKIKRRRTEQDKKYEQDYTYTYESHKKDVGVLKKAKSYDGLQKSTQEKRGRKKSDSRGKVTEHTTTEKTRVKNRRSNKQHKAKHGGK